MSLQNDNQEITTLGDEAKAKELPEGVMVILRVLEGPDQGKGVPVHQVPVTLGRDAMCDISFNDSRMSRQHSMIFYYAPNFHLKDLGSTNGTFLSEQRIKQAVIASGDKFKIGSSLIEFIVTSTQAADPA